MTIVAFSCSFGECGKWPEGRRSIDFARLYLGFNDIPRTVLGFQIDLSYIFADDSHRQHEQSAYQPERAHDGAPSGDHVVVRPGNDHIDEHADADKNG